jgi:hypothetical protein
LMRVEAPRSIASANTSRWVSCVIGFNQLLLGKGLQQINGRRAGRRPG